MKIFHPFEYQKYKNYHDNFLHSVFNIINILINIIIYFISFNTIELNEL